MKGTVRWTNPATGCTFVVAEDGRELFGKCVIPSPGFFTLYEGDEIDFQIEEVGIVSSRMTVTGVRRNRSAS
jgi:cold shock CspA family protein